MAALDFPDSPATGDLYGSSGTVWRWDGARWASTAGASGARGRVAYAQITASQTGVGASFVDIGGLSVTWAAYPDRVYRITASMETSSNVAGDTTLMRITDPAGVQVTRGVEQTVSAAWPTTTTASVIETGRSGYNTRKVQVQRAGGTGTVAVGAAPDYPAFILVEDITYEAGTSGGGGGTPLLQGGRASRGASAAWPGSVYTTVTWVTWDQLYQQAAGSGTTAFTLTPGVWSIGVRAEINTATSSPIIRVYFGGAMNTYAAQTPGGGLFGTFGTLVTITADTPISVDLWAQAASNFNVVSVTLDARKISALP